MGKGKNEKDDGGGPSPEEQASILESKRLQELTVSRGLLSRFKAHPSTSLRPSKTIQKCDGKDIVKRGYRKNKYLFAFPGIIAPITGGKFGDLTNLDTRNPTFYVDFPQGRLKLSGTIVYPKNKYLTMHFSPGRGAIVCEDCFESIVVFPEAWWIGTKEENPEELQLPMPTDLQQEKHVDVDFVAGASDGRAAISKSTVLKAPEFRNDAESPESQSQEELLTPSPLPVENENLRRSGRKASTDRVKYDVLQSASSDSDSSDTGPKQRRHQRADKDATMSMSQDFIQSQSSISRSGATTGDMLSEKSSEAVHDAEASKGSLRQASLTSFLTKTGTQEASNVEGPNVEELSQRTESGVGILERARRTPKKKIVEEPEEATPSSEGNGEDSSPKKSQSSGSRGARGRGRGRGRAGRGGASPKGRQAGTPKKANAKKQHSVTEISSSDDESEGRKDGNICRLESL